MGCNFDGMLLNNEVDLETFSHWIPALVVLDSSVAVFTRCPPTKEIVKWAKEIKCIQYKNYCCNFSLSLHLAPFIFSQRKLGDAQA
jgi:hypothetical protein